MVYDDDYSTLPYLRSAIKPPNWKRLVDCSRELVTESLFDVTETWNRPGLTLPQHFPRVPSVREPEGDSAGSEPLRELPLTETVQGNSARSVRWNIPEVTPTNTDSLSLAPASSSTVVAHQMATADEPASTTRTHDAPAQTDTAAAQGFMAADTTTLHDAPVGTDTAAASPNINNNAPTWTDTAATNDAPT